MRTTQWVLSTGRFEPPSSWAGEGSSGARVDAYIWPTGPTRRRNVRCYGNAMSAAG